MAADTTTDGPPMSAPSQVEEAGGGGGPEFAGLFLTGTDTDITYSPRLRPQQEDERDVIDLGKGWYLVEHRLD